MTFITRGIESLEVTKEDSKATRSGGKGVAVSANRALARQCEGEEGGGALFY